MTEVDEPLWLEWWANSSTCLGSVAVSVAIDVNEGVWTAQGHLVNDDDAEDFAFLCELGPVFTLRIANDGIITVNVHSSEDHRQFTLTEYDGPTYRQMTITFRPNK